MDSRPTCVEAGVLLHAPLAYKQLLAVFTLELLGEPVQRPVDAQAVLVGERLAAHLAGVRPHPRVVQHVDPEGVQLRQGLAADVADELSLGVRRQGLVLQLALSLPLGSLFRRGFAQRRPVAALLLVPGQVRAERGGVLELLMTQLHAVKTEWSVGFFF